MSESVPKRKLIEVALPLEKINLEATRDGAKRKNHPWRLHYWWARRKLSVARTVLFSQLVDDPSSHPDRFPTEEAQRNERKRLHELMERLATWENMSDASLLEEAQAEILKSSDGNPPTIFDPFAGGGSIPLEAQRLGLEARASDLNPVAVLINKALIEIPPKFSGQAPAYPNLAGSRTSWRGAEGLAADVRAYGEWMHEEAKEKIGLHYPKVALENGEELNVIAWIWARTMTCPNPACGIQMPLVRSWWLGRKKGNTAYVVPEVVADPSGSDRHVVRFHVKHSLEGAPNAEEDGTVGRTGARCVNCGSSVALKTIREISREVGLGSLLMAIVAKNGRHRTYLEPSETHAQAASVAAPPSVPEGELFDWPGRINVFRYGLTKFSDLFTNRQLLALTTFSDLVEEARERILTDSLAAGRASGERLADGGTQAQAYADAVATYLGLALSRGSDYMSNVVTWHNKNQQIRNVFARQAIPMSWDFLETNFLFEGSGTWVSQTSLVAEALDGIPASGTAVVTQAAAQNGGPVGALISTDPPYYDNVGYSDLSDFFYVWLRRSLRDVHPDLLGTILVPKAEELVANPYRHDGREGAKSFFEQGFFDVFAEARKSARDDYPITVYYAFKQSDSDEDGDASSGWEVLLDGMIRAGWEITSTWPFRTETTSRMLSQGANALASSIVLSLRPRPENAASTDRRHFLQSLKSELPNALRKLEQGHIAPVDLPQAAIGPGMAVFSRYSKIVEADGTQMTVRSALARINEILDEVLNEQEGDFDSTTRFVIAWYRQHGYSTGKFGDANNLANARNTSVDSMAKSGVLTSAGGNVKLLSPTELPDEYDPTTDDMISTWEILGHMLRVLSTTGVGAAAALLDAAGSRRDGKVDVESVKELAFLLFPLAEKNGWTQDALAFNTLATAWPEILGAEAIRLGSQETQAIFDLSDGNEQ